MDYYNQRPDRDPRPTLQVITTYPPQSQTSNYSYPLSGTSPGRESVGSDISSVPSMIEDHGSDISTEDEYQYHNSRSGGLWNCFWNNTQAQEKDPQTTNTPTRPISHYAGSTPESTPERKKNIRPTLASSRPDSGFAQDNNQWPLTSPHTSPSHQVPRNFNKPLPTSTYSLFPPTPPSDTQYSSSVPPPRRSSLARPWTSDTLRLSEQTPPSPKPPVVMCMKTSLGRKRKLGGEPLAVTVCSPSPRCPTTSSSSSSPRTTTASLVFRARPSIIPVPSSTGNLSRPMAPAAAVYNTAPPSLCPQPPYLTPTDFRRSSLTNLRRNSRGAIFPRPPSKEHPPQTRAHHLPLQQLQHQQQGLDERPLPSLPLTAPPQQQPQRPPRSSPPSLVLFPVPPTSPLPPLPPPPPPPSSTLAPPPAPPVVSVFETDSDDDEFDSDSSSDEQHSNHFAAAGGVVESFARRIMRSLLGSGHGGQHQHHYSHESRNHHQRSVSSDCCYTATSTTSRFTKAIHLRRPRSDGAAAAQQLDVIEESTARYDSRYRKSCSNAREGENLRGSGSGSGSGAKQTVLGRRGRLWGRK